MSRPSRSAAEGSTAEFGAASGAKSGAPREGPVALGTPGMNSV
jgi:hypothetical protein